MSCDNGSRSRGLLGEKSERLVRGDISFSFFVDVDPTVEILSAKEPLSPLSAKVGAVSGRILSDLDIRILMSVTQRRYIYK